MLTHNGHKRQFNIIMILLVSSMLIEQLIIAKIIPGSSRLLGINPIPVVLGVPVNLALNLGLLPMIISFITCYVILFLLNDVLQKNGTREFWIKKIKSVFAGFISIPFYMLLAGLFYYILKDHLPRGLKNAFESFGINLDVYTFFPGSEIIHLQGSVFLLAAFILGIYIFIKRLQNPLLEIPPKEVSNGSL